MIIRRATYNRLIARADAYAEAARDNRRVQKAALDNTRHIAAQYVGLDNRLTRTVKACARYRAELAIRNRRIRHLEQRLDNLLGLDTPEIEAGARWQERRPDKPKETIL